MATQVANDIRRMIKALLGRRVDHVSRWMSAWVDFSKRDMKRAFLDPLKSGGRGSMAQKAKNAIVKTLGRNNTLAYDMRDEVDTYQSRKKVDLAIGYFANREMVQRLADYYGVSLDHMVYGLLTWAAATRLARKKRTTTMSKDARSPRSRRTTPKRKTPKRKTPKRRASPKRSAPPPTRASRRIERYVAEVVAVRDEAERNLQRIKEIQRSLGFF